MTAYLIANIDVHDPETYAKYAQQAPAFIEKHGGRYIVRGGNARALEGDWSPQRLIVIEFPSVEHATAFIEDPEYRAIAEIRWSSSTTNLTIAEGYSP